MANYNNGNNYNNNGNNNYQQGNQSRGNYNGNGGNRYNNNGGNRRGGNGGGQRNNEYNTVRQFGLKCFRSKPTQSGNGIYLDCSMSGKFDQQTGNWGQGLSMNVIALYDQCDVPAGNYDGQFISVDGRFTISDYTRQDGSVGARITIYATRLAIVEKQQNRNGGNRGGNGGQQYQQGYQNNGNFQNGGNNYQQNGGNWNNGGQQNGFNNQYQQGGNNFGGGNNGFGNDGYNG